MDKKLLWENITLYYSETKGNLDLFKVFFNEKTCDLPVVPSFEL